MNGVQVALFVPTVAIFYKGGLDNKYATMFYIHLLYLIARWNFIEIPSTDYALPIST